jgi:hypothetical protein
MATGSQSSIDVLAKIIDSPRRLILLASGDYSWTSCRVGNQTADVKGRSRFEARNGRGIKHTGPPTCAADDKKRYKSTRAASRSPRGNDPKALSMSRVLTHKRLQCPGKLPTVPKVRPASETLIKQFLDQTHICFP